MLMLILLTIAMQGCRGRSEEEQLQFLREIERIDLELADIAEQKSFETRFETGEPLEMRFFREGAHDILRLDLNTSFKGLDFIKTSVYREATISRFMSEIIMMHTEHDIKLFDFSGTLLHSAKSGKYLNC